MQNAEQWGRKSSGFSFLILKNPLSKKNRVPVCDLSCGILIQQISTQWHSLWLGPDWGERQEKVQNRELFIFKKMHLSEAEMSMFLVLVKYFIVHFISYITHYTSLSNSTYREIIIEQKQSIWKGNKLKSNEQKKVPLSQALLSWDNNVGGKVMI